MRFAKFFEVIAKLINYGLFSFKYEQIKFANEYILSAEHIASTKFCIICILSAVILFLAVISGHLSVLNFFFCARLHNQFWFADLFGCGSVVNIFSWFLCTWSNWQAYSVYKKIIHFQQFAVKLKVNSVKTVCNSVISSLRFWMEKP